MPYIVIWRGRVERLDRKSMIITLYGHYLRVLARLGLARRPADTPFEFAEGIAAKISFGEHDFNGVTGVFVRARYGQGEPDDCDCSSIKAFDRDFSKYCRKHSGLLKYLSEYLLL